MIPIPGAKKVKMCPADPHPGPRSTRIRSVPTERQIAGDRHSQKRHHCNGSQQVATILCVIFSHPAQCRDRDHRGGSDKLRGRKRKQIVGLLVESKRGRAKAPADQKVVGVARKVIHAESSVGVHRELQHCTRAGGIPWTSGHPSAQKPRADGRTERQRARAEDQRPVTPTRRSQTESIRPPKLPWRQCRSWPPRETAWPA